MKIQTNINAVINTKEKYKCEYKVTNNGLERNTKKLQMQICANTKKIFSSLVPFKLSLSLNINVNSTSTLTSTHYGCDIKATQSCHNES